MTTRFLALEFLLLAAWLVASVGLGVVAARLSDAPHRTATSFERSLSLVTSGAAIGLLASQFLWLGSIIGRGDVSGREFETSIVYGIASILVGGVLGAVLDVTLAHAEG